ncbi:MAG: acylneuraminate cytidylyltransferase family protein, partial [Acidobacteriota bacterium]
MSGVVALIPARGGSKGLPGKNLRPLAGRPLVAHTIAAARAAASVDRVVVSTDSAAIASASRAAGAEVIDRPAAISGDTADSESALLHALDVLRTRDGYRPALVVFLQCTAPLRTADDIDAAVDRLREAGADSVVSVTPFHGFLWQPDPIASADTPADAIAPVDYDPRARPRRQDRAPSYVENGAIYVVRRALLEAARCRLGGRVAAYVMPARRAVDVDTAEDLA